MRFIFRHLSLVFCCCLTLFGIATSFAQDFPTRTIRIVVPSGAGSLNDTLSRLLLPELSRILGQTVVVENMPGAAGILAARYITKQPADGHALLAMQTSNTVSSVFVKDPGFDLQKDLAPVVSMVESPLLLKTYYGLPFNTFAEMAAYAKANPGKLNHGLPGPTDLFALYMGAIRSKFDINIVDIPYKSSTAYHQALAANEVQLAFSAVSNALPMFQAKKAKPLAVSGERRHPLFPDVPTFTEVGVPEVEGLKFMVFAPAGTPKAVIDKLNAAYITALQHPDMKVRIANLDLQYVGSSSAAMAEQLGQSFERYRTVARNLGIKPQ